MLRKCQRHWEEQERQRRNGQGAGHLPNRAARLQQRLLMLGRKGKLQPLGHSWDSSVDGESGNIVSLRGPPIPAYLFLRSAMVPRFQPAGSHL